MSESSLVATRAMRERTCSLAVADQNEESEQSCCLPRVCYRSIARRALVFRGCSVVPARRAVSIGAAARPFLGRRTCVEVGRFSNSALPGGHE